MERANPMQHDLEPTTPHAGLELSEATSVHANSKTSDPTKPDAWPHLDRRRGKDRRQQPTPAWSAFLGYRGRKRGRRAGENINTYVDRFSNGDVVLVITVLILNILDALFTMLWLQRGGSEANPIMAWLLEIGNSAFLVQKCLIVGLWLVLLLVHKNFRIARVGLWALTGVYSLLLLYHLFLISFATPLNS